MNEFLYCLVKLGLQLASVPAVVVLVSLGVLLFAPQLLARALRGMAACVCVLAAVWVTVSRVRCLRSKKWGE